MDSPSFYREIKQQIGTEFSYAFFKELWSDMFTPNQPMMDVLPKFRDRYQLVLLSNTNALHMEYCQRQFPIFHHFDHLIFSHEVGRTKPDAAIFQVALERSRSRPDECAFVDDTWENVRAAGRMGITAYRFLKPECLAPLGRPNTRVSVEDAFLRH
jgi:putative hydrolase of the HAD superfamily